MVLKLLLKEKGCHNLIRNFRLEGKKTTSFVSSFGSDPPSTGQATDMEFLVIASIMKDICETCDNDDIYAYLEDAHLIYGLIISLLKTMAITGPLFQRSKDDIAKILKQYIYYRDSFVKTKVPPDT